MAKKPVVLTGRTEILAAIYNPDYLPSAVLCGKDNDAHPFCLHVLREEDLSYFERNLMRRLRSAQFGSDDAKNDEKVIAWLWPFFEDFPSQRFVCSGCAESDKSEGHRIEANETFCRKTTEDCA